MAAEIVNKVGEIYARIGPASDYGSEFDLEDVAEAQIEAGDIEGALRTAQLIGDEENFGRALLLHKIAYALAATGDVERALATEEYVSGAYLRIVVVTGVGYALAEAGTSLGPPGSRVGSQRLLRRMSGTPAPPYTAAAIHRSAIFQTIVDAHIAAGTFDKAQGALEQIERGNYIANAAMAIAKAQMAEGDLDGARTAVDTVCEFRRRIDRCVEALSALATAHASAGNIEKAQEFASLAWEGTEWTWFSPERFRAFVSLWQALMGMSDVEAGRKAFAKALSVARYIDIDSERIEKLPELGVTAAQMGEFESAAQAFSPGHGRCWRVRGLFWNSDAYGCQAGPRLQEHRQGAGTGG